MAQVAGPPSPLLGADERAALVQQALRRLRDEQATAYDRREPQHEALLLRLWQLSFPEAALTARVSDQWKALGFQGSDPATDFRGMGLLGLRQLLYLATAHTARWRGLLAAQERRRERQYPVSVAGINLTHLLLTELWLPAPPSAQPKGQARPAPAHLLDRTAVENVLLAGEEAANEVYCAVFEQFDLLWDEAGAHYMDFPKVLAAVRLLLQHVFAQPLTSLASFRAAVAGWRHERVQLAATLTAEFSNLIASADVTRMLVLQHDTLELMHSCNMTLESFNAMYLAQHSSLARDYERYTRSLRLLKDDMDNVFRRIRVLRSRLSVVEAEEESGS